MHVVHHLDLHVVPPDAGSIPLRSLFFPFQLVENVTEKQVTQHHARAHQYARVGRQNPAIEGEIPEHAARGVHDKREPNWTNQLRTPLKVVREEQKATEMVEEHLSE